MQCNKGGTACLGHAMQSPLPSHPTHLVCRQTAAQLAAFVPCSVLEAMASRTEAGTPPAGGGGNGGNGGGSSDAEIVMVDAPGAAELAGADLAPAGGGSSASLEAVPAGGDALLLVPCSAPALRRAAVAYLDGLVEQVGGLFCFGACMLHSFALWWI